MRVFLKILIWLAIAVGSLVMSLTVHLNVPFARQFIRKSVNALVTHEIKGELEIGKIVWLAPWGGSVRQVRIRDGYNTHILSIAEADIDFDLIALTHGVVHLPKIHGHEVHFLLTNDPEGDPTLFTTFDKRVPTPTKPGGGVHVIIDRVEIHGGSFKGNFLGLEAFKLNIAYADGRVELAKSFMVNLHSCRGTFVEPFPFEGHIEAASGTIDTNMIKGIHMGASLSRNPDHAWVHLDFAQPEGKLKPVLNLEVSGKHVTADTLRGLEYPWAKWIETTTDGTVSLVGPAEDMRLEADLSTTGGPVTLSGRILAKRHVHLSADTPSMRIDQLVLNTPAVTVAGKAILELPLDDDPKKYPEVTLLLRPFMWGAVAIPAMSAHAKFREDDIRIDKLHATANREDLDGSGSITYEGNLNGKMRIHINNLAKDANVQKLVPNIYGSISSEISISTNIVERNQFDIHASAHFGNFKYAQIAARSIEVDGELRGHIDHPSIRVSLDATRALVMGHSFENASLNVKGGPTRYVAHADVTGGPHQRVITDATVVRKADTYLISLPHLEFHFFRERWHGSLQNAVYTPDREIKVSDLILVNGTERLEGSGRYGFDGSTSGDLQLQDFQLSALSAMLGRDASAVDGHIDAHVHMKGSTRSPIIEASGSLRNGSFRRLSEIESAFVFHVNANKLDGELDLNFSGKGELSITGTVANINIYQPTTWQKEGDYDVQVRTQSLDLELLKRLELSSRPLRGRVTASADIAGSASLPHISANLFVSSLGYENWGDVNLEARIRYERNGFQVESARVTDTHGDLVSGHAFVTADILGWTQSDQVTKDLSRLPWQLHLQFASRAAESFPGPVADLLPAGVRVGSKISLEHSQTDIVGTFLADVAWYNSAATMNCNTASTPELHIAARLEHSITRADIIGGPEKTPVLRAEMISETPILTWLEKGIRPGLPKSHFHASMKGTRLEQVPWACRYGSGPLELDAQANNIFTDSPNLKATVASKGISIRYASSKKTIEETAPLRLDATIETTPDKKLHASIMTSRSMSSATTTRCGTYFSQYMSSSANRIIKCGSIKAMGARPACVQVELPIRTEAPLYTPAFNVQRELTAEASFYSSSIEPLLAFIPKFVEADAIATGYVRLENGVKTKLSGRISVEDGCTQILGFGSHLTSIRGMIRFQDNHAIIDKDIPIQARDGEGRLAISGNFDFEGMLPEALQTHVVTQKFPVRNEGVELALLEGQGDVKARLYADHTDAKVTVGNLLVTIPEQSTKTTIELDPHPDITIRGQRDGPDVNPNPHKFHIMFDGTTPFTIKRDDFSVEVVGVLDSYYADPALTVRGYIEIRKGYFEVFSKRLSVRRGSLTFDGGNELNPLVDLQAVYVPRGQQNNAVIVTVNGRIKNPTIDFATNSPGITDRSEILALLITGRRDSSRQVRQTLGDEQAVGEQTVGFLSSIVAGLVAKRQFGDIKPIIAIEGGQTTVQPGQAAYQSTRVRVGVQLDSMLDKPLRFLRPIITGAYVEGFTTVNDGSPTGGANQNTNPLFFGGIIELYFPNNFVSTILAAPTANNWGFDLTWEP